MNKEILPGHVFGYWTALDEVVMTSRGEKKRLCRCICGTERYVLERSLKAGSSRSCGCLRKETSGRRTRCSSKTHEKNYPYVDIAGKRFGRLVAQYRMNRTDSKGSCIWHCVCDCGNEIDVSYNTLMYTNQTSCGCKKKEHDQLLRTLQTRIDGTSLEIIRSKKVPADNTTGVKGVYYIRGKYVAKIVFRKKVYYLGTYETLEEAAGARREAEQALFQDTVDYYKKWKRKADADPEWASVNPMKIVVTQKNGHVYTSFLPKIDESRV